MGTTLFSFYRYLAYIHHPTISPLLIHYDLGSSDNEAQHSLILDRQERRLYVASVKDTQKFLAQQWPERETIRMTQEEWTAYVTKALKNVQRRHDEIDMDEIHKRIEEQYALVEALQNWLNKFLPN